MPEAANKDQQPLSVKEVSKEHYITRLSPDDQKNLQTVESFFRKCIESEKKKGSLYAVGGSITKPPPRPDIDLVIRFDENDSTQQGETHIQRAERSHAKLKAFLEDFVAKNPDFQIDEEKSVQPAIDEEFGSPNILKHEGSVVLKGRSGTPLEFVNLARTGTHQDIMGKESRPFVVLASV